MAAKQKEKDAEEKSGRRQRSASSRNVGRPSLSSNGLMRYLRETRGELRKVTWPTREESWRLTGIVILVTIAFIIFLGVLDWIFSSGFQGLIDLIT